LIENSSEEYIRVPNVQSVSVSELLINDMQTIILNNKRDPEQEVIFFLHGGAYLAQPVPPHFNTALDIIDQTDAKVVMPIYPKSPVYNYKDAYPKLMEAYRQVLLHTSSSENISFMGDSAGGGLAAGLSSLLAHKKLPQPRQLILISPWLDASSENPDIKEFEESDTLLPKQEYFRETGLLWAGGEENIYHPLVSPLYSTYLKELPPTYVIAGGDEMLYPDILRFEAAMSEAGGKIKLFEKDNMVHDYAIFNTPEGQEARDLISQLILS
jgi:acetyl esterase/lipase